MLTDEELPPLPEGWEQYPGCRLYYAADQMREYGRAVEQAAYAAAIKAIEATRIDPEDVIEEVDRETNRTIDWCVEVVRSMLPKEQPK